MIVVVSVRRKKHPLKQHGDAIRDDDDDDVSFALVNNSRQRDRRLKRKRRRSLQSSDASSITSSKSVESVLGSKQKWYVDYKAHPLSTVSEKSEFMEATSRNTFSSYRISNELSKNSLQ